MAAAPIRLLLIAVPRMIAEIIEEAAAADSRIHLVANVQAALETVTRADVNVVVMYTESDASAEIADLLWKHPSLKVVTLVDDGRQTFLHELVPQRRPL